MGKRGGKEGKVHPAPSCPSSGEVVLSRPPNKAFFWAVERKSPPSSAAVWVRIPKQEGEREEGAEGPWQGRIPQHILDVHTFSVFELTSAVGFGGVEWRV